MNSTCLCLVACFLHMTCFAQTKSTDTVYDIPGWSLPTIPTIGVKPKVAGKATFFVKLDEKGNIVRVHVLQTTLNSVVLEAYRKALLSIRLQPKSGTIGSLSTGTITFTVEPDLEKDRGTPINSTAGVSYDSSKWSVVSRPLIYDESDETGMVDFRIKVDAEGRVADIRILRTTLSPSVTHVYQKAVQQTLFRYEGDFPTPTLITTISYKVSDVYTDGSGNSSTKQEQKDNSRRNTVSSPIIRQPEYVGGMRALAEFISTNLRYPAAGYRVGLSGRVFVRFTINTDGSLTDVDIIKGLGYGADEETVRLIKSMPKWRPGAQDGKPISVKYDLPINFEYPPRD